MSNVTKILQTHVQEESGRKVYCWIVDRCRMCRVSYGCGDLDTDINSAEYDLRYQSQFVRPPVIMDSPKLLLVLMVVTVSMAAPQINERQVEDRG